MEGWTTIWETPYRKIERDAQLVADARGVFRGLDRGVEHALHVETPAITCGGAGSVDFWLRNWPVS